jgi:cobalamin biosynthesis Mg chelatase CobN
MNVDRSLRNTLIAMKQQGYDLGSLDPLQFEDDAIVGVLRSLYQEGISGKGINKAKALVQGLDKLPGAQIVGREVAYQELRRWLGKEMTAKIEKQWG